MEPLAKTTDKPDDSVLYVFALIGAFAAGVMLTLVATLAARNQGLRQELDQRPATPAVIVVKGGAV